MYSGRRRRASRSTTASPQSRSPRPSLHSSRRASLATTESDDEMDSPPILMHCSPRPSLGPDSPLEIYHRSQGHIQTSESRSNRNSITPETMLSRNTLSPSRYNLGVEPTYGSRLSLNPQDFNRSPRNSLTPDISARSPRRSLVPEGSSWNHPRNTMVPDVGRSPRHSVASIYMENERGYKGQAAKPNATNARGRATANPVHKRKYIDLTRSPRGSLIPDSQKSPRGSLVPSERSARGSLSTGDRASPRGSVALTFQEPLVTRDRRASEGSQTAGGRGRASPHRPSTSGRQASDAGSRRASSCVSQVSGDEQRRLCSAEENERLGRGNRLTSYGSIGYQLKNANHEASGPLDFVWKAAKILKRTIIMTVFLACSTPMPVFMLILGVQYIRDCPLQPHLPTYFIVGGAFGMVGIFWALWAQVTNRSLEGNPPEKCMVYMLLGFMIAWFVYGNYLTLDVVRPMLNPSVHETSVLCHHTLSLFSIAHITIIWSVFLIVLLLFFVLGLCQVFSCRCLVPPENR